MKMKFKSEINDSVCKNRCLLNVQQANSQFCQCFFFNIYNSSTSSGMAQTVEAWTCSGMRHLYACRGVQFLPETPPAA